MPAAGRLKFSGDFAKTAIALRLTVPAPFHFGGTIMKLPCLQILHLAAGAAALPIVSLNAWAQVYPAQSATKYAASGLRLKLTFFASSNPDCSNVGRPTIRITRAPEHGRVTVTQTSDFPNFSVSNIRNQCNHRRVAGAAIYYVSRHGFTGTDFVDAEIIFVNGALAQWSYTINVR
jgi:hypothetical protein